jgi:hypothetical protein
LLFALIGLMVWFLVHPRNLQTFDNVPEVVDEDFQAHGIIDTTEDPREVRPIAVKAAKKIADRPAPGHGDSLTFDWPQDPEPHDGQAQEGPLNRT